jgi:hypothetical protein
MSGDLDGRCFVRRGNALVPADIAADDMLSEIAEGKEIIITYRKPRSPLHHRWFFSMLRKVCEATGRWQDEDELLDALKLATGHVRRVQRVDGDVILLPRSINFASMPEGPFTRFKNRALWVIQHATGIDPEALMAETDATQRRSISPAGAGERADPPPATRSTNPSNDRRRAVPVREVA